MGSLHGTNDSTVLVSAEAAADEICTMDFSFLTPTVSVQGAGHGLWEHRWTEKGLDQLIFDFITTQQGLLVE